MIRYDELISSEVAATAPSGIRRFFDMLADMPDVISLTVGQPDFVTPWHIREAAIESLEQGKTYYTSNAGMPELRREISAYLKRRFDVCYEAQKEILVTVGGSEAIDIAIRSVINGGCGDEVIVPTPSFVCYAPLVAMAGGVPVILQTREQDKFKIMPEQLEALITPKTKMIVLPYPNNPTGAIMEKKELEAIADVIRDKNILVLSDEIYAEMTYGKKHCSFASLPDMKERTILVSGFSKAYAMTGWRLGYLCAPAPLATQIAKLHQYAIMCAPTTSQFAAIEALKNGDEDIEMMTAEYNRRRKFIYQGLVDIGIDSFEPEGAFYIYPDISGFGISGDEFCERLVHEKRCAIVPGSAFGAGGEGFARISYAYSMKHIESALERIADFTRSLRKGK